MWARNIAESVVPSEYSTGIMDGMGKHSFLQFGASTRWFTKAC